MNQQVQAQRDLVPVVNDTLELAKIMASSGLFTDARDVAQAGVKILAGRELGFGPVQSMTGIYLVKGRITISANLIAAAIRRHRRYDYTVTRLDDQRCDIEFSMDTQSIGVSSFTIDDAKKAGLAGNDNWKKYPRNMLFARAISNGARWFCPDVFGGPVYTPDEFGAAVDAEEGQVIEVLPPVAKIVEAAISSQQHDELERLIAQKGADAARLRSYYGVTSLGDLTPEQFVDAVGRLRGRPDVQPVPPIVVAGVENSKNCN